MLRNEDKRRSHPWVLGLLEACWGLRFRPICAPKRINSSAFKSHLIQADHSARLEQFAAFDLPILLSPPVRFSRVPTKGSEVCGADSSVGSLLGLSSLPIEPWQTSLLVRSRRRWADQPARSASYDAAGVPLGEYDAAEGWRIIEGMRGGCYCAASWRGILAGQGGRND